MKTIEFYRNIPFVDIRKDINFIKRLFPFHFQRTPNKKRVWIEIPFIGCEIKVK